MLGLCAQVVLASVASASTSTSTGAASPWHLTLEAGTDVPVQLGGRLAVEGPFRLRGSVAVGFLPGPYVDLINETSTAFGWYGDATASLIETVLEESLVARFHLGWRPYASLGLYADVGYTVASLGGGTTVAEVLSEATGRAPPRLQDEYAYRADATLHVLDLEVGYEWLVFDDEFLVRAAVGYAGTVASSTSVESEAPGEDDGRDVEAFERALEVYLDDVFTSYVHLVVLTLGVGWRAF